jgi:hypothetical protein
MLANLGLHWLHGYNLPNWSIISEALMTLLLVHHPLIALFKYSLKYLKMKIKYKNLPNKHKIGI